MLEENGAVASTFGRKFIFHLAFYTFAKDPLNVMIE